MGIKIALICAFDKHAWWEFDFFFAVTLECVIIHLLIDKHDLITTLLSHEPARLVDRSNWKLTDRFEFILNFDYALCNLVIW